MRHDDVLTAQRLDGTAEKGRPMSLDRRQAGGGQHMDSVPRSALNSSVEENVVLSELMQSQEYQRARDMHSFRSDIWIESDKQTPLARPVSAGHSMMIERSSFHSASTSARNARTSASRRATRSSPLPSCADSAGSASSPDGGGPPSRCW